MCKDETGVSSGEAGLEGIFEGEEIGDKKVTIDDRVNGGVHTRRRRGSEVFFCVAED